MRRALVFILLALHAGAGFAVDWVIASSDARAQAGERFELLLVAPPRQALPAEVTVRIAIDVAEILLTMKAARAIDDTRRVYAATMPEAAGGPVSLRLAELPSNVLVIVVSRKEGASKMVGVATLEEREPPLSENDPMYFIAGTRGGTTARFQLSFKYRLFDASTGFGQERPWLSGLYFGYTQNSLWDISSESKAFRDTSYRPSLFWKWERTRERTFFDGARLGLEHESNGAQGDLSRSINIAFVRPEWRWQLPDGGTFAFTPKIYGYLDKEENPDIDDYRGYVDWRFRFDSGGNWIATTVFRYGTANKGSVLFDLSRRTRDLKFGPISTYLHMQIFAGYGEDILDYNVKNKSQLRFGFAIVP